MMGPDKTSCGTEVINLGGLRLSLGMGLDNVWTCRICGFIQRRWKAKIKSCVERGFVSTTITTATTTTGFGAALVVSQYSLKHGRASSTAHLKKWLSVISRLSHVQHRSLILVENSG